MGRGSGYHAERQQIKGAPPAPKCALESNRHSRSSGMSQREVRARGGMSAVLSRIRGGFREGGMLRDAKWFS